MQNLNIEDIIFRSLTGAATSRELQELERWMNKNPDNARSYQLLKQTWLQTSMEPEVEGYSSLEQEIISKGFDNPGAVEQELPRRNLIYKIAAALVVICVTSWIALEYAGKKQVDEPPFELVETYNPAGQKSKITLPDNSVIFLNSESKVSYQKGFSDSIRYITLEGEAYFEVEPNQHRPFVVETGGISTQALGTSFNIRNFPEEKSIEVSLLSGKVKVTDNQAANEVLLEPLEHVAKMSQFEVDNKSIWKEGIINFKSSSFNQVITTLQRTYDVEIDTTQYRDTDWKYTGRFDNMSLEIVLTRIGYSEGFEFEMDGRRITLTDEKD